MNKKISKSSLFAVVALSILSIFAVRLDSNPMHMGLVFSFVGIAFIGLFTNKYIASVIGALVVPFGYLSRLWVPISTELVGDKLEKFIVKQEKYNSLLSENLIYFILISILIGLVFGYIGQRISEDKAKKFSTNKLTYMAIFVALSAAINSMRVGSVSFGGFPIIFSGYLLGPLAGFIVGGVADIVGFIIRPSGFAFSPLFTLTSALTGLIPILVTESLGDKYPKFTLLKVVIGVFIGQILTSVILVPIFSVMLYGKETIWVLAVKSLLKQIVSIPIYAFLITTINDRLTKVIDFNKEFI